MCSPPDVNTWNSNFSHNGSDDHSGNVNSPTDILLPQLEVAGLK
jgi:hypothetical protein